MSFRTEASTTYRLQRLTKRAGRRVLLARFIGLIAGLGAVGIFVIYLEQSGFFAMFQPIPDLPIAGAAVSTEISGTNADINGYDQDGLPFRITSSTANQDSENSKLVHMQNPRGTFERSSGKKIDLTATAARYNTETKVLHLEGDVVFEQHGSYKAKMLKAELNLRDLSLTSKSAVRVEMGTSNVKADHLEISDNGKKTLFTGHVKANLKSDIESGIVP